MEKIISLLADVFSFRLIRYCFFLFLLISSLSSCFKKFYKTNTVATTDSATLCRLVAENKIFILHTNEGAFALKDPTVNENFVVGTAEMTNPKYAKYLNPKKQEGNRLSMSKKEEVLNQVHLYTGGSIISNGKINLEINRISRIDVYGFDEKATKNSRITSIVGIGLGVGAIIGIGIIASNGVGFTMNFSGGY